MAARRYTAVAFKEQAVAYELQILGLQEQLHWQLQKMEARAVDAEQRQSVLQKEADDKLRTQGELIAEKAALRRTLDELCNAEGKEIKRVDAENLSLKRQVKEWTDRSQMYELKYNQLMVKPQPRCWCEQWKDKVTQLIKKHRRTK